MSDPSRIRIDIGNITAQVRRLRDVGSDLGRIVRDLEAARRVVADGWNDPTGQAYLAANEALLDRVRREVDEILATPDKFQEWIRQWQDTIQRNLENAMKLPD